MDGRVYDSNFTEEISKKMRVPSSIKGNGEVSNNGPTNVYADDNTRYSDRLDMKVPEKIVISGNIQHKSSRSKRNEFSTDDLIVPQSPTEEIRLVRTSVPIEQSSLPTLNNNESATNTAQQKDPNMSSSHVQSQEEVARLRRQMSHLWRRVFELEHTISQPFYARERKLIVTLVCGFTVWKFTSWLASR